MDSLNHKCRKSQSHSFTSYQLARLGGWGFPELADYTELEVCAGYSSVSLLPLSLPLLSTTTFLTAIRFVTHKSPLPFSPHTCFIIVFLTPPWCFWHCTFLPPIPGRILTSTCLPQLPPRAANPPRPGLPRRNWGLWTTVKWGVWRRLFGSSSYTNSGLSAKETQPSTCVCEIQLGTDPYSLTSLSSTMVPEASQLLTPLQLRPCWRSQNQWTQNPTCSFFGEIPCLVHFFMAFPVPPATFAYKVPGSGCLPYPAPWDCRFHQCLWLIQVWARHVWALEMMNPSELPQGAAANKGFREAQG